VRNLRRAVARLRPQQHEAFLRLQVFCGEQAQVDWASFGTVMGFFFFFVSFFFFLFFFIFRPCKRALSCLRDTLSGWSQRSI